jgi:hypothetical protein
MSYCSKQLSNGGTIALEFHPRHRSVLRAVVAQARCSNTSVPVVDTNALVVIVRDENGRALQGVTLEISIADKALIKTRAPEIKQAVLTTDSAGRARFSGLGHTVYQVDIHKPYIRTMFDQMETDSSVRVIVDSSQTSLHVTLAKAVALRVRFDGLDVGSAPVVSAFRSSPTLRADIIECRPADIVDPTIYEHYLLPGSYVIAPSLMGKKFIPQSQRIEVHPDSAAVQTKFTAEETAETAVSIVIGSGFAHRTLLPSAGLTGGDTYELYDTDSGKTVATGVVPATGVAVAEEMSALAYYGVRMKIDTATYAPWYQQYSTIVPLLKQPSMLSVKRERLRPLLARSYVFSRKAEAFSPLFTPVILQDQLNARATTTSIDVPFELPTGGSTVAVHRNGFVTFGSKRLPRYTLYPLSMTDDVDAIISPLGTELVADTNAPNPWHVGYEIQGIAPNRTLVIEWQELSARVYDPETGVAKLSGRFTFQLRIYEVGTIEFVYKRPVALTYPVSAQIGIRGADVLDNSIVALQSNSAREAIAGFEFEGDHLQMINELTDMPSGLVYRWSNDHVSVANENVPRLSVAPIVDGITITSDEYLQHVRLYSLVGNLVHERTLPGTRLVISMRDLPAGIYTIVATGEHSCNVQTIMHLVR